VDHTDHVALLRPAVTGGGTWADIGAGAGAFTLAMADLLDPGARIVAVDLDAAALRANAEAVGALFPATDLSTLVADLEGHLDLPPLDGLVAANSLHYVPNDRQVAAIRSLAEHLRPGGRFVVVEYNTDRGNPWVPHPFSSGKWVQLAMAAGLERTTVIGRAPSRFLSGFYASASRRPSAETSRSMSPESL
jgi:SAM-dependent methyltransferase